MPGPFSSTKLKSIIYIFTFFRGRLIKTMKLVSSYVRLIIPGRWTWQGSLRRSRTKIPKGEFARPMPLSIHSPSCQTAFFLSSPLVVHTMMQSFKRMRLINHLGNGPYSFKIGAIRSYPVNANISNKEHTHFAFTHSFGSKQPCQHVNITASGFYDCHRLTSLDCSRHIIL